MNLFERLLFLHRVWRYRLRSEPFCISYLLSRDLAGTTALDVGANRGLYSYWMHKKVGGTGQVIAFEPQPELLTYLHSVRKAFSLERLTIEPLGLSSSPGELTLARPRDHWGGASVEWKASPDVDLLRIEVTTIDDYCAAHVQGRVGFIKCDVEGHERHVFEGARRILREDQPDLLFECHDARNPQCEVFRFLEQQGYDGFCFSRRGLAPVADYASLRDSLHRRALTDFVFMPRARSAAFPRVFRAA